MTVPSASDSSAQQSEQVLISELFHAISQPLTALECGLEVSLRRDKTAAQFRTRVASALVAAKLLHQRLLEARVLQEAGEPGDPSPPVALKGLLLQLLDDFLPVAESRNIQLDVKCETAMVRGNEARFKNGFFHLFEFLLRTCPSRHSTSIRARLLNPAVLEVTFSNNGSVDSLESGQPKSPTDLSLRIAQRTFQAAGGNLVLTRKRPGRVTGYVRLLLAN
ncbi:MAG TPA: hypothetical protein VIH91_01670 [Terriglobales bacterium]